MLLAAGYVLFGLAAIVAIVNFYLSFLRAPICRLLGGDPRNVTGIPAIGTLFLIGALICVERTQFAWAAAIVLAVLDTGGLPWFLLMVTWMALRQRGKVQ